MSEVFMIRKNSKRYPGICRELPEYLLVSNVTAEQADFLAACLTNREPGCDWAFYREGGPADE